MATHITTTSTSATAPKKSRRIRSVQNHGSAPYILVAPAVVLFILFIVIPVIYTLWLSLFAYRVEAGGGLLGTRVLTWAGFENYASVLQDSAYRTGLLHVVQYGIIAVPLMLGLALLFALLLDTVGVRSGRFSRPAIFVPYAVPGVIAALLWGFLYLPSTSPFSAISNALGAGDIPFLEHTLVYGSLANIGAWGGVGFNMIILYTALRSIPTELLESARLDGASEVQVALRIKVPMVIPALVLTSFFALIGTLQLYNEPQTIRTLSSTISPTWAPLMTIYRDAFLTDKLPAAAAASVMLALLIVGLSLVVMRLTQLRRKS